MSNETYPQLNIETRDKKCLRILEMPSGDLYLGIFAKDQNGTLSEVASTPIPMERRDLIAEFVRV